jgi:DNA-binding NarL/FixJ family response regulator
MVPRTQDSIRVRVLIADDNEAMRNTVIRLLTPEYEVVGAVDNGRALVDAELELKPDIGIVDISMPILNGVEAAHEIKKHGSKMKIVFLTVNEDPDFVDAAMNAGASGYVVKKQMASDLVHALGEAREGRMFISSCCSLSNGDTTR